MLHSLSKRSNAAGLRSGFIAGDARVIADFFKLRAYASAVQPLPLMAAGTALWGEESHVEANRAAYRRKFDIAERRLSNRFGFYRPDGGFFLWLDVGDGEAAAVRLWQEAALRVLPGGYLGVTAADGSNPGQSYIRLAMVHDEALIAKAVDRLVEVLG
ncbi:MAG: aminotransferase class I/II-fold pyridoxal phosphate-dependent enzyme [Geminicoccaceae bacterium]